MKNKRQTVNSLMVNFNYENGVMEYQLLFTAFANYFSSSEKDEMTSKMQIAHFLENFLRKEQIQESLTITDINGLKDNNYINTNINNIKMYQNILLLIYEELSSNNKKVSHFILEIISNVSSCLINYFNNTNDQINNEDSSSTPDCFNCDKKFICNKDTRDIELIEQLRKEDQETFSNLTKNIKEFFQNDENIVNNDETDINDIVLTSTVDLDSYFVNDSKLNFNNSNKNFIKEYLLRKNLIPYECNVCGINSWQNTVLPLELDIIDFRKTELNNYRFLCPNCYSQIGG